MSLFNYTLLLKKKKKKLAISVYVEVTSQTVYFIHLYYVNTIPSWLMKLYNKLWDDFPFSGVIIALKILKPKRGSGSAHL